MGQRESTQGVKRKREEVESNNEREKLKIIEKITTDISGNKPIFIEKSLMLDCKEEQDILYVLLGEVHPEVEKLEEQANQAAVFINTISQSIKDTNQNVSLYLLTERSTCGSDFSIYWNHLHKDLSSKLYSEIISCDTRNEFLVCEATRLLNNLRKFNDISNPNLYINKFFELIEKHKEIMSVTEDIIDNPENIFNYPPLKNKNFDEQTKTKIIKMITDNLNDIINKEKGQKYGDFLKEKIKIFKDLSVASFLSDAFNEKFELVGDKDRTFVENMLVKQFIEYRDDYKLGSATFGFFVLEVFYMETFDIIRTYVTKLYGVIMDAEVMYQIQTIKNSEKDKKLKVIMIYAGSEHIKVYEENLFSELICNEEKILLLTQHHKYTTKETTTTI